MPYFLTPTKSDAETVKIGLSIDFKRINRFWLDGMMVGMGAVFVNREVIGQAITKQNQTGNTQ
jgi:hypothetical protein